MLETETRSPQVRPKEPPGSQPDYFYPPYASSVLRAPSQPLVVLPHTLSERTGPVFGHGLLRPNDNDLTAQHTGQPLGERMPVSYTHLDVYKRQGEAAGVVPQAGHGDRRERGRYQ